MEVCPCKIIEMVDQGTMHFIPEKMELCQECGQCMAVCSSKAIQTNGFIYDRDIFNLPDNKVGYLEFMEFLAGRRSVRNFKNKPVPLEVLKQILGSISFAPFGASPEKMEVSIIYDRKIIESALPHIQHFLDKLVNMVDHPIASRILKRKTDKENFNTLKHHIYPIAKSGNYKLENGDRITRGAPSIIIFHAKEDAEAHSVNSIIYATYVMLAAHAYGLGATMIQLVPAAIRRVKELREIFKIPKGNEAIMSVVIGYPKYKYLRAIKRNRHKVHWIG
jgi:nitroreductase